jgi:hypothetical protein
MARLRHQKTWKDLELDLTLTCLTLSHPLPLSLSLSPFSLTPLSLTPLFYHFSLSSWLVSVSLSLPLFLSLCPLSVSICIPHSSHSLTTPLLCFPLCFPSSHYLSLYPPSFSLSSLSHFVSTPSIAPSNNSLEPNIVQDPNPVISRAFACLGWHFFAWHGSFKHLNLDFQSICTLRLAFLFMEWLECFSLVQWNISTLI